MKKAVAKIAIAALVAFAAMGVGRATPKAHGYCLYVNAYIYWTTTGGSHGQVWGTDEACSNWPHTLYLAMYKLYQGQSQVVSADNRTSQTPVVKPFFTPRVAVTCGNWYRWEYNDLWNYTSGGGPWEHPNLQAGC